MRLREEQLRKAAILARDREIAELEKSADWNVQPSAELEARMRQLITQIKQGQIAPAVAPLGWQYYTKRGAAAVLVCALISCAAAPQAAMAGYEKLIAVVEIVLDEYTEFHYTSNTNESYAFCPLVLQYLPAGLEEIERDEDENSIDLLYMSEEGLYFNIHQCLILENSNMVYGVDTEQAKQETVQIQHEAVTFIYKENRIQFIWLHGTYHISGQTNLSRDEAIKILEQTAYSSL